MANPDAQARVWAEQTGFPTAVGRVVVDTAQTRTVAIDDTVIAAQQRLADFLQTARVIRQTQTATGYFDRSFNAAVWS